MGTFIKGFFKIFAIGLIIFYIIFSFVKFNLNAANWSELTRVSFILISCIWTLISLIVALSIFEDESTGRRE